MIYYRVLESMCPIPKQYIAPESTGHYLVMLEQPLLLLNTKIYPKGIINWEYQIY